MSYILDALVRADGERRQQSVPGLHTVQLLPLPDGGRRQRRLSAGFGFLAAGLAVLAWTAPWRWQAPPAPTEAVPGAAAMPQPPAGESLAVLPAPMPSPAVTSPDSPALQPVPAPQPEIRRSLPSERAEAAPRPGSRLYSIAQLPATLQKTAQEIRVAGFAHASDTKERMAIINDRAWREGDEVTEGLRVESISSDGVVFNLKGYRFRKGAA